MQPITSNFFTAIGKPTKGMFLSLTRQIIFLLPLIVVLPMLIGIDGILYAGPIADFMAGLTAIVMAVRELKMSKYLKVLEYKSFICSKKAGCFLQLPAFFSM